MTEDRIKPLKYTQKIGRVTIENDGSARLCCQLLDASSGHSLSKEMVISNANFSDDEWDKMLAFLQEEKTVYAAIMNLYGSNHSGFLEPLAILHKQSKPQGYFRLNFRRSIKSQ